MKRPVAAWLIAAALFGCRTAPQPMDPFLSRTTVPPPGTGQAVPAAEPYYQNSPALQQPQVVPGTPSAQPGTYAPPPSKYAPQGGFNFQQSSIDRAKVVIPQGTELRAGPRSLARRSPLPPPSGDPVVDPAHVAKPAPASAPMAQRRPAATPAQYQEPVETAAARATEIPAAHAASPLAATLAAGEPGPARTPSAQHGSDTTLRVVSTSSSAAADDEQPVSIAIPVSYSSPIAHSAAPAARDLEPTGFKSEIRIVESAAQPEAPGAAAGQRLQVTASNPATEITSLAARATPIRRYYDAPRKVAVQAAASTLGSSTLAFAGNVNSDAGATVSATVDRELGSAGAQFPPPKYAYDTTYRALRGKLEYSQAARQWKLRYIPIDGQTDTYGGSVVLPASAQLEGYKPGDFVAIQGALAPAGDQPRGFSPTYHLSQITPIAP